MTLSDFDEAHVGHIIHGHGTWFTARLLRCLDELLAHADEANRAKLLAAFPDEVEAVRQLRALYVSVPKPTNPDAPSPTSKRR